nr:Transcription factor TFIIIB component B [Polyrhizophydium stewartii]
MPPPIRVTIPNSSLSRAESPPAPQATQLAASLQTLVQPEDEEHIYHDVFDTDLDMYGTQSSVATMHRIPQRVNAPPIPRNAKPAAASADAHEGEDQRDSIHQRTASATRRRSLSPLRSPLATSSGMYLPPLIRRPFGVADIASLSMNDLVGNELIDGRISKAEEARRQLVKEHGIELAERGGSRANANRPPVRVGPARFVFSGPRVQFVNGQIQIDATSLLVQAPNENVEELQRVDEAAQRYVTSSSFRQRPKLRKVEWTTQMTKRFYDGLSYFGTDFYLIALMFPSLDRDHIKRKFNNEDQASVTRALKQRRIPPEELRTRMMSYITEKKKLHAARFPSQYKPDEDYPVGHSSAASASTSPAAADAPRADRNTRATTATPEPDDAGVVAKISDADTQPNAGSTSAEPNKENDELVIPRALSHLDLTQTSKRQLNSAVPPESAREDGDAGQVPSEHDAPVESANGSGPSAIDVDEPVSAPAASRPAGKPIVRRVGGISIRTPAMQRMAGSEAVSAQPSQAAAQE